MARNAALSRSIPAKAILTPFNCQACLTGGIGEALVTVAVLHHLSLIVRSKDIAAAGISPCAARRFHTVVEKCHATTLFIVLYSICVSEDVYQTGCAAGSVKSARFLRNPVNRRQEP
jgi:hypothetical protein